MSVRLKILFVGPSKAGKSSIASFIAGFQDGVTPSGTPTPTVGVRILELERHGMPIELWDVSGDQRYEATWPACQQDAAGIVLLYDPEALGQAVRPIPYEFFASFQRQRAEIHKIQSTDLLSSSALSPPSARD
jgi:GTPase SAR1 family protein